jgi:distribution and morphology protein 34
MRKRKKRVVDLRKKPDTTESTDEPTEGHTPVASTYASETSSVIHEDRNVDEPITPPMSPAKSGLLYEGRHGSLDVGEPSRLYDNAEPVDTLLPAAPLLSEPPKSSKSKQRAVYGDETIKPRSSSRRPPLSHNQIRQAQQSTSPLLRSLSFDRLASTSPPNVYADSTSSGGILEQAWMLKMAQEIARKVQDEKDRAASSRDSSPQSRRSKAAQGLWTGGEDEIEAPPAYVA